jgi:hypothetical protein
LDWTSIPHPSLYLNPLSSNTVAAAKETLLRYQPSLGTTCLQDKISLLNKISETNPSNVVSGDLKVKFYSSGDCSGFNWYRTFEGFDYPLHLSANFIDGQLSCFSDFSSYYHVGCSDVKISREEAVTVAKVLAGNLSLGGVFANLCEEPLEVTAEVGTREAFTQYPLWHVLFALDEPLGSYTCAQVGIWADNGGILYCQLVGNTLGDVTGQSQKVVMQAQADNQSAQSVTLNNGSIQLEK